MILLFTSVKNEHNLYSFHLFVTHYLVFFEHFSIFLT